MNIPALLWHRQREVFLYDCEAYRVWMERSGWSVKARSYAEFPLAVYISCVMSGIALALGDLVSIIGRVGLLILFLLGSAIAHVLLRPLWREAGMIYARYRPLAYWRQVIEGGSITFSLFFSLAITTRHPLLTPVVILAHWLFVGTFYFALLNRRRVVAVSPNADAQSLP